MLPTLPTAWTWSRDAFVSALALSLLHSLWQGVAIGAVGFALRGRLKRATPDIRGGAYLSLLLTIFGVWLATLAFLYQSAIHPTITATVVGPITGVHANVGGAPTAPDAASRLTVFFPTLVALWALGVCGLSLRHIGGFLVLRRLYRAGSTLCSPELQATAARIAVRLGLRRRVTLLCSARIEIPFAFGLLRPYVLLPMSALTGLTPAQIEALIAHELAHLARHDVVVNALQICVETILFYHPVVRWLSVQIRDSREERCDDLAVQVVGDRAVYARALYSLEEARASLPQLALAAKGDSSAMSNTHLLGRIQRILGVAGVEKRDPWAKGVLALGAVTIGLITLLPAQAHPAQDPPAPPAPPTVTVDGEIHPNILLKVNDDQVELHGVQLAPDTKLEVNGKEVRFGDLSADQQSAVKKALSGVSVSFISNVQTSDGKGVARSSRRVMMTIGSDTIDMPTTEPGPETHLKFNGVDRRFGKLTSKQQIAIHEAIAKLPIPNTRQVLGVITPDTKNTQTITLKTSKKFVIKAGGDEYELESAELAPDTRVKLNGVDSRYGDLSEAQKATLQKAIAAIPVSPVVISDSHP